MERLGAVVFGLIGQVAFDAVEIRAAHAKGAVADLPGETAEAGKRLVNPFGRIGFNHPKRVGHGDFLAQRNEQMDVVYRAAGGQQRTAFGPKDATEVFVKARLEIGRDPGLAVFGAENDVVIERGIGLRHESVAPNGACLFLATLNPGADAPGYWLSPLRGFAVMFASRSRGSRPWLLTFAPSGLGDDVCVSIQGADAPAINVHP